MANDGAASIFGVAMRVTRLDAAGAPLVGANNLYVTDTLTELTFTPEFKEGVEIEQENAAGGVCVTYKAPDKLKRLQIGLGLCTPDPELIEMLVGGVAIQDGGETVGYASSEVGADPTPHGVSLEVWTRAIIDGDNAATDPYWRWLFPRVRLRLDQRAINTSNMVSPMSGHGSQNPSWGDGPTNDWPYVSNRVFQHVRASTVPTAQLGYQAVA